MTPTGPGQLVRTLTGKLGITTSTPYVRSGQIGVQLVGGPYPVKFDLEDLTLEGASA